MPYEIHTVPTDNGMAFADLPKNRDGFTASGAAIPSTASVWSTASSTG